MNRFKIALDDKTVYVNAETREEAMAMAQERLAPMTVDDAMRTVGSGVQVVGGGLNALNATTNAVLSYPFNALNELTGREYKDQQYNEIMGPDKSFSERVTGSKAAEDAKDERLSSVYPMETAIGNTAGNVLSSAALFRQVPGAFSTGKGGLFNLGKDILRGGATTGGLSAADTFVRTGGDMGKTAESFGSGFIAGAAIPIVAKPFETAANLTGALIKGGKNMWATGEGQILAKEFGENLVANGLDVKPAVADLVRKQGRPMVDAIMAALDPNKRQLVAPIIKALLQGRAAMEVSRSISKGGGGF